MALRDGAPDRDVNVHGLWADPPGHVFYAVVDAPHAHAITELTTALELSHWNTVEVRPVMVM